MPDIPIRATLGLALALLLAAFAAPADGADDDPEPSVEIVAAGDPVILDLLEVAADVAPATVPAVQVADPRADVTKLPRPATPVVPAPAAPIEPAPEPAPAPTPPPAPAPVGSLDEIIQRHFGSAAGQARAIAQCESNMNPGAVSPTNDHGLFQINIVHRGQFEAVTGRPWSDVYDPEANTTYARYLHGQQGWGPWACRRVL